MTAPLWTHHPRTWWRHQMKTFSALRDLCVGNSPVTGEFPAQRPMTRSFDVFYDLRPNRRFSKQPWVWWFETPSRPLWRHCDGFTTSRNLIWRARQVEWTPHSGINWLVGLCLNSLWKFSQVCIGLIQAYLKPFTLRIYLTLWSKLWFSSLHCSNIHCPACRTSLIATRFWVVVICPIIKCHTVLEFSFILFDLCLFITIFNFILNYVPIVTFWIFTYHKIWILLIIFCFIWNYWII